MNKRIDEKRQPDEYVTLKTIPLDQQNDPDKDDLEADDQTIPMRPMHKSGKSAKRFLNLPSIENSYVTKTFQLIRSTIFLTSLSAISFYAGMYNWWGLHEHAHNLHVSIQDKIGISQNSMSAKNLGSSDKENLINGYMEKLATTNINVREQPNAKSKINSKLNVGDIVLVKIVESELNWDEVYLKQPDPDGKMIRLGFVNSKLLKERK